MQDHRTPKGRMVPIMIKQSRKSAASVLLALLVITTVLVSVLSVPASAAVNLLSIMDAHAYANNAIAENTVLPYRIYLPDALTPYFPADADNASAADTQSDADANSAETDEADAPTTPAAPTEPVPGDTAYGLLIWLHDEDCRGNDNVAQLSDETKNGLLDAVLSDAARAGDTIILAPQCPAGTTWTDNQGVLLTLLCDLIQNHLSYLRIDASRIFVAGISMGATAGYHLIANQSTENALPIAAAYLVAGTSNDTVETEADAAPYLETAIYAFFSDNDTVTPSDTVRALADTLITTYHCPIRYAIYPDVGHEVWPQAFAEQELLNAFIATNAPAPTPVPVPDETTADTDDTIETNTPKETEPKETDAPETVSPSEKTPGSSFIAGIEITPQIIAYGILAISCILAVILLIAGLVKNNRGR